MGGSTGGGFKVVRFGVMTQHAVGEIRKVLHPRAVIVTRVGKTPVRPEALMNVMAFLALYVATHAVGTLVLTGTWQRPGYGRERGAGRDVEHRARTGGSRSGRPLW